MFDDFFVLQTEICASNRWSGCKEIDQVSDELKTIYQTGQIRIAEDVDLSVNSIEKLSVVLVLKMLTKHQKRESFLVKL